MADWRPIPDFTAYEASSLGDIRRIGEADCRSPAPDGRGYGKLLLKDDDGRWQSVWLHRLVCAAFHGPALGREARHLDGEKSRSTPDNLAWGSRQENAQDRKRHMSEKSLSYTGLVADHRLKSPDARAALGRFLGAPKTLGSIRRAFRVGLINKNKALELIQGL